VRTVSRWLSLVYGIAGAARIKSETKETFTIITTEPSKFAAQFHNRMPLVLESDTWDLWMKGELDAAAALMKPANEDILSERVVSKAVGNVKNNGPDLLASTE
jgi:putative SOS response-associated peptidase YedK